MTGSLEKKLLTNGAKARQNPDPSDRTLPFRDWIRTVPTGAVTDADMIIWHGILPVAVLELTRTDSDQPVGMKYLKAINHRYYTRDKQATYADVLAGYLRCKAYIVLFHATCQSFWVHQIDIHAQEEDRTWKHYDELNMKLWLASLGGKHGTQS